MEPAVKKPYRHGNLPNALRAAMRVLLEEPGALDVGLREAARRVGVSAPAAYRHFTSKEDLLASVATEGFGELLTAMASASDRPDPQVGRGLAYVEFAMQHPGLFRLMFGPMLKARTKYPALNKVITAVFDLLEPGAATLEDRPEKEAAAMAAWGLMHGLSSLFIDGVVPAGGARALAEQVLCGMRTPKPQLLAAA